VRACVVDFSLRAVGRGVRRVTPGASPRPGTWGYVVIVGILPDVETTRRRGPHGRCATLRAPPAGDRPRPRGLTIDKSAGTGPSKSRRARNALGRRGVRLSTMRRGSPGRRSLSSEASRDLCRPSALRARRVARAGCGGFRSFDGAHGRRRSPAGGARGGAQRPCGPRRARGSRRTEGSPRSPHNPRSLGAAPPRAPPAARASLRWRCASPQE